VAGVARMAGQCALGMLAVGVTTAMCSPAAIVGAKPTAMPWTTPSGGVAAAAAAVPLSPPHCTTGATGAIPPVLSGTTSAPGLDVAVAAASTGANAPPSTASATCCWGITCGALPTNRVVCCSSTWQLQH
jgi:hypothetical protein